MSYNAGVLKLSDDQIVSVLNLNDVGLIKFLDIYGMPWVSSDYAVWIKDGDNTWISTGNSKHSEIRSKIDALPFT